MHPEQQRLHQARQPSGISSQQINRACCACPVQQDFSQIPPFDRLMCCVQGADVIRDVEWVVFDEVRGVSVLQVRRSLQRCAGAAGFMSQIDCMHSKVDVQINRGLAG